MIDRLCFWYCMRLWVNTTGVPGWVLARAGSFANPVDARRRIEGES